MQEFNTSGGAEYEHADADSSASGSACDGRKSGTHSNAGSRACCTKGRSGTQGRA